MKDKENNMKLIEINTNVNWTTISDCQEDGLHFEASSIEPTKSEDALPIFVSWDDFWVNLSKAPTGAYDYKEIYFAFGRSIKNEDIFLKIGKYGIPICPNCKPDVPCDSGQNYDMYSDLSQTIWSCPKCESDFDILKGEINENRRVQD